MQIKSFEDLVNLSFKFHEYTTPEKLLCTNYNSLDNNSRIINVLYSQLNTIQKKCFEEMHSDLSNRTHSITLLDSRPGTGKSHLMASLGLSSKLNILFVVYKQELVDYMQQLPYWDCYTAAKFKIRLFQLNSFRNNFSRYEHTNVTISDILIRIFILTKMMDIKFLLNYDVFIIDEYTVLNPEMVLAFCLMAIIYKKHIIFCGDRCQQNSIDKSKQSSGLSNYHMIYHIATRSIKLENIIRCLDDTYNQKLETFRNIIETSKTGSTPLNFSHMFTLYLLFKEHFYQKPVFDKGCYFAIHHKMLTEYIKKFKNYLIHNNIKFGESKITNVPDYDDKFYYTLLLVPGMTYIYNKKKDRNVPLGEYQLINFDDNTLEIRDTKTSKIFKINKVKLACENILDSLYERLNKQYTGPFYQFPLTPLYTSTYHNAQGLTINTHIDINLSKSTCESVYVGLSRIKNEKQLNKIECEYLRSLEFTHQQNDEYYYIINENSCENFKEIRSIKRRPKTNYKIKKIRYDTVSNCHNSPLITCSKYMKKNTETIIEKYKNFKLPKDNNLLTSNLGIYF